MALLWGAECLGSLRLLPKEATPHRPLEQGQRHPEHDQTQSQRQTELARPPSMLSLEKDLRPEGPNQMQAAIAQRY